MQRLDILFCFLLLAWWLVLYWLLLSTKYYWLQEGYPSLYLVGIIYKIWCYIQKFLLSTIYKILLTKRRLFFVLLGLYYLYYKKGVCCYDSKQTWPASVGELPTLPFVFIDDVVVTLSLSQFNLNRTIEDNIQDMRNEE